MNIIKSKPKNCVVFPLYFVSEVLNTLSKNNIKVISYADIKKGLFNHKFRYLDEFYHFSKINFKKNILFSFSSLFTHRKSIFNNTSVNPKKNTFVLLQHDADLFPDKTCDLMEIEARNGVKSSNYFFHEIEKYDYSLDICRMQKYESEGFEIGYHLNAYERSGYNKQKAGFLLQEDLDYFKSHFNLRSFVPHGGVPGPGGVNNIHFYDSNLLGDLLWAYNGDCILKHSTWSDGGITKNCPLDPRIFINNLPSNTRNLILMHPQYYGDHLRDDWKLLPLADQKWWRKLWEL